MFLRFGTFNFKKGTKCIFGVGSSRVWNSPHRYRFSSSSSSSKSSSFLTWYSNKLETQPFLTKGLTSGFIAGLGDFLCQLVSSSNPSLTQSSNKEKHGGSTSVWDFLFVNENGWDIPRTIRFCLIGTFWVAPVTHVWYRTLSMRLVPGPSTAARVTQRVALDQLGFGPIFTTSFMSWLWLLEGRDDIVRQLQAAIPDMIVAGWTLWIPAMSINFSVVPIKYQVLFSNVVALIWNVYLSYKSSINHLDESNDHEALRETSK